MRLDQLEALVHHRRGVDGDLGAHVPVRMRHRLRRRDGGHARPRQCVRNGPPEAVRMICSTSSALLEVEDLEDGAVLGIDRQQRRAVAARSRPSSARRRRPGISLLASADHGAAAHGRQRRLQPGGADDRRHHPVGRPAAASTTAVGPAAASMPVPASASFSVAVAAGIGDRPPARGRSRRACSASSSTLRLAVSASTSKASGLRVDQIDGVAADRAGRAEDGDAARRRLGAARGAIIAIASVPLRPLRQ